jgi:hypothetical protein
VAIAVEKGKASSPARIAGRFGDPKDILFSAVYSYHRRYRLQSGAIDGGVGAIDRSVLSLDILAVRRWLTARYVKRLTTVSATTCGSYIFSKEKTAGDQRADNQQDQDELKTIAPQHGALQKKRR